MRHIDRPALLLTGVALGMVSVWLGTLGGLKLLQLLAR